MKAGDVTDTLCMALQASGCDQATVLHKPRLLSDNGVSDISDELTDLLEEQQMEHVGGAPHHRKTQCRIEPLGRLLRNGLPGRRWHRPSKPQPAGGFYLPGGLQQKIDAFIGYYQRPRYHERLHNLTPVDVYFGRAKSIIKQRERIKQKTIETKRSLQRKSDA